MTKKQGKEYSSKDIEDLDTKTNPLATRKQVNNKIEKKENNRKRPAETSAKHNNTKKSKREVIKEETPEEEEEQEESPGEQEGTSDSDFVREEEVVRKPSKRTAQIKKKKSNQVSSSKSESEPESEEYSDDDDFEEVPRKSNKKKAASKKATPASKKKKGKSVKQDTSSEEEQEEQEEEVESDTDIYDPNNIKKSKLIIPRPKGSPFADAISPDTLVFLANLIENNDRDYMHSMVKEWTACKKDFTDFCGLVMHELHEVDQTIRMEEAKNAVYRQNRDLRFSNDKRPYKTNMSASFSRTGRKFLDAGYHISVRPDNKTIVAAGVWQPNKEILDRMRNMIIRNGDLLREALSTDAIKEAFDGKFGVEIMEKEDMLKNGPKGIEKNHPEIELLKFRSFAVTKSFTDEEVVSPGFLEKVMDVFEAVVPFVAVINSWV